MRIRAFLSLFRRRHAAVAAAGASAMLLVIATGPAAAVAAAPTAARPDLQPHRAVYEMDLAKGASSSFSDGFGRIVIEMSDTCDGFIVSQRQRVELVTRDGGSLPSDVNGSTWEAKDGGLYRFSVERLEGVDAPSRIVGRATIRPGEAGKANYRQPAEDMLALPKGTLFPTSHLAATIAAAKAGKAVFSAPLYDGYEPKVFDVSAAISPVKPDPAVAGYAFATQPAWSVRFAFYDYGSRASVPSYEIDLHLYANGVASEISFDYGEFRLDGHMTDYQELPRAQCD